MGLCYPCTPKKKATTAAFFLAGVSLFGYGLYLWHANIGPQRARIEARNEFVRARFRQKQGQD